MARCNRCNKFMLFSSASGFCKSCDEINAREAEEKRRKEEEERQRKAEEERRRKEEEERQRKEEERRRKEEEERQRKAEEERRRKEEEEQQRKRLTKNSINGIWELSNGHSMQIVYPKVKSGDYESAINYCGNHAYEGGYIYDGTFVKMGNETYTLIDYDVLIDIRDDTYGVTVYYRADAAIRKENIRSGNLTSEQKARYICYGTRENTNAFEQYALKSLLDSPTMGKKGLESAIMEYLCNNGMTREEAKSIDCSWMTRMFLQSDYDQTYIQLRRMRDMYQR